jgi:hypothetical protein
LSRTCSFALKSAARSPANPTKEAARRPGSVRVRATPIPHEPVAGIGGRGHFVPPCVRVYAPSLVRLLNAHWPDVTDDEWSSYVVPVLARMTRRQLEAPGVSGSQKGEVRDGTFEALPRRKARLTEEAGRYAREQLRALGITPPVHAVDCCAALACHRKQT